VVSSITFLINAVRVPPNPDIDFALNLAVVLCMLSSAATAGSEGRPDGGAIAVAQSGGRAGRHKGSNDRPTIDSLLPCWLFACVCSALPCIFSCSLRGLLSCCFALVAAKFKPHRAISGLLAPRADGACAREAGQDDAVHDNREAHCRQQEAAGESAITCLVLNPWRICV
jgi:hypothetical protein